MKKIFFISISISLVSFTIIKQLDLFNKIEQKLTQYTTNHPEKIYIHTDKPFYSLNDDIWFSTYLVNGITHQKTDKSKVVHVELINAKDSIVSKRKLYFLNTAVSGDFKINENWKPGNYILRAYTKYMQNESSDFFFQKEIPIYAVKKDTIVNHIDFKKTNLASTSITHQKPNLNFYPESGSIITGVSNKVAFKIKDSRYSEINLTGVIKDENHQEVVRFKTLKLGIGSFIFTPQKGKTYYASIHVNNKEDRYPLPKSINKGFVLNISNTGKSIIVNTKSTLK